MAHENDLELGKENTLDILIEDKEVKLIDVLSTDEGGSHLPKQEEPTTTTKTTVESISDDEDEDLQPLLEQPTILEGKRSRKPTSRLEISALTPLKKELSIPQGRGKALGEIDHINQRISHATTDTLSRMGHICFGRRAIKKNIKKHLRQFQGFDFDQHSDGYQKQLNYLAKLKKDQLRSISELLGLSTTGRNTELAERILKFLIKPTDQGKTRSTRKSSIRTMKKRSTVPKRTKKSTKPTEPAPEHDEQCLMNCQVRLDDFIQQADRIPADKPLLIEPTEENLVKDLHDQTDLSEGHLVIDENPMVDVIDRAMNNSNPETSF